MSRVYLVRHGEAAAGWGDDPDPGLSDRGRQQATAMAAWFAGAGIGPLPVVTSPLRRTRETAAALEAAWGVTARVDQAVGEVPSPTDDVGERMAWLGQVLATPWADWPAELTAWRASVTDCLAGIGEDTVVVTHYVLITVAAGRQGYQPDHCSVTVLDNQGGALAVVAWGDQRATVVR